MTAPVSQFKSDATRVSADLEHRTRIQKALDGYYLKRDQNKSKFQDWQTARQAASAIKKEAIDNLGHHLEMFASRMKAHGTHVFWATTAQQARDYILQVAQKHQVKRIIKSKSMTTEEIHLNDKLEEEGYEVVESDLGEFIQQLRKEPPYHFVFPSMHLSRHQISETFQEQLGAENVTEPEELTLIARRVMRQKYLEADMGITGANFAVAETGMISITENEGNARLTAALPKIHVAVLGIEKVIPRMEDLALLLPMLATAGAGQALTGYNTLYAGPKGGGEADGPLEFHVVLLDNGRTTLLADPEQRDALHCIRCGACLNVCPIFKNVGGFTYGTTYQGPIGSVITPHYRGLQDWKHLSFASSLCGACTEACPVGIDLHHHLLRNRRNAVQGKSVWWEKCLYLTFAFVMQRPILYRMGTKLGALLQRLHVLVKSTPLDPLQSWTKTRDLPMPPLESFNDYWRKRQHLNRNQR